MARWLLLLCTVIGVAAMHTLGHTGMAGHDHESIAMARSSIAVPASTAVRQLTAVIACTGDRCPAGPGHGSSGGWSVCLAILTGLALVALLAVRSLAARRRGGRVREQVLRGGQPSRAPPTRGSGLTITATTVLRI